MSLNTDALIGYVAIVIAAFLNLGLPHYYRWQTKRVLRANVAREYGLALAHASAGDHKRAYGAHDRAVAWRGRLASLS